MKKLIVIANDLERSGKSTLARAIAHHLVQEEVDHLLISSDENDLDDEFPGEFWDLDEQIEASQLVEAVNKHEAVILEIRTGAARNWADFCESEEVDNLLAELDAEMTLVIPDTGSERCNEEIADLAELFSDSADYVIARLGDENHREIEWKKSEGEKAVRHLGCVGIALPGVHGDLQTALDSANATLPSVLNQPADLPRFAEVQLCQWLEEFSGALAKAGEYLMPEAVGAVMLDR